MKTSDSSLSFIPKKTMKQLMGISSEYFSHKRLFMTRKWSPKCIFGKAIKIMDGRLEISKQKAMVLFTANFMIIGKKSIKKTLKI